MELTTNLKETARYRRYPFGRLDFDSCLCVGFFSFLGFFLSINFSTLICDCGFVFYWV